MKEANNLRKRYLFCFLTLFLSAALLETASAAAVIYLHKKAIIYFPHSVTKTKYETSLKLRDPVLGWPSSKRFGQAGTGFDRDGSRLVNQPEDPSEPVYVSVYGDSFSFGYQVDGIHTYPHVLAQLLKKRVKNYGVGGYGTDQAYLRFIHNSQDEAKVVILGYTTENILRNVNRYRNLIYPWSLFGLKPRFVASSEGGLTLITLPEYSYDEFIKMVRSPGKLEFEYFVPGGPSGIYKAEFPFTVTLIKTLFHNFRLRAIREGSPWYKEFYEANHGSGALPVTIRIMKQFEKQAIASGKQPLIAIIPTYADLKYYKKTKGWVYENMIEQLKNEKMEFVDAGPLMINELNGRDPKTIFMRPGGHFNEKGYELLARIIYEHLKK